MRRELGYAFHFHCPHVNFYLEIFSKTRGGGNGVVGVVVTKEGRELGLSCCLRAR
jgi:hypothetical protein